MPPGPGDVGVPPDSRWRWEAARWPHDRWLAWLRRADDLEPPKATAAEIRAAHWRAYREMTREESGGG